MEENQVIKVLSDIAKDNKVTYISGTIEDCGTNNCKLSSERGGVYGIAVKLNTDEEKKELYNALNNDATHKTKKFPKSIDDWKTIGDDCYPLYWGKDQKLGSRLYDHTKKHSGKYTLQLDSLGILKGKTVIYGAILCLNKKTVERKLHVEYPDVLKTVKGKKE